MTASTSERGGIEGSYRTDPARMILVRLCGLANVR
jgi:hypothetical protein